MVYLFLQVFLKILLVSSSLSSCFPFSVCSLQLFSLTRLSIFFSLYPQVVINCDSKNISLSSSSYFPVAPKKKKKKNTHMDFKGPVKIFFGQSKNHVRY